MALFPQQFIDDLKAHADIVLVIQDYVSLKKAGANYKGLCPFHGEKTPSFQVNRDKGFFHCFGCNVGGDVFKFLELHEKIGFQDAVKLLAQRFGLTLPELEQSDEQRAGTAEREALLNVHERAAAWFRQQLDTPAGTRIRRLIAERGVLPATDEALGLGFAPPARDALKQHLLDSGFSQALLVRSGLVTQRDDGTVIDRFRNRLMIPICRDTGSVIAFGGRALEPDQHPKYLNSPETPIYTKGRTLYGLHLSKAAIRQSKFAVLVEGYFDFAQVYQAGFQSVVASSGTALTPQQVALLRRFTARVVLSFDPDAAGQGAAARSCEMLVAEGFEVNVAMLPPGQDPDTFVRTNGARAYGELLRQSKPYLDYLLDRAAAAIDLRSAEGRARLVAEMMPVATRIPDEIRRQLFAEALSGRAMLPHEVVWAEIQKVGGPPGRPRGAGSPEIRPLGQVTKAEKALIWWLVHHPDPALDSLAGAEPEDFDGLASRSVLDLARKLKEDREFSPSALLERLSTSEARLVTEAAAEAEPPSHAPVLCIRAFRKARYERERAAVQQELDRLQRAGAMEDSDLYALLTRKGQLVRLIESLAIAED